MRQSSIRSKSHQSGHLTLRGRCVASKIVACPPRVRRRLNEPGLQLDLGMGLQSIQLDRHFERQHRRVRICSRREPTDNNQLWFRPGHCAVLAPKRLDLLDPFLRSFIAVERALADIEQEGFFGRHLSRLVSIFDRHDSIEDLRIGQPGVSALGAPPRIATALLIFTQKRAGFFIEK